MRSGSPWLTPALCVSGCVCVPQELRQEREELERQFLEAAVLRDPITEHVSACHARNVEARGVG